MKKLAVVVLFVIAILAGAGHQTAILGPVPNPAMTPGVLDTRLNTALLTSPTFRTGSVRNVSEALKRQVFADYGMDMSKVNSASFEVDHFIPIGIGGASVEHNLWPQPLHFNQGGFDVGALTKDRLEDELIREVRTGTITPAAAQAQITGGWIAAYAAHFGTLPAWGEMHAEDNP